MSAIAFFGDALTLGALVLGLVFRLVWDAAGNILVYHPAGRVIKVILHGTYNSWSGVLAIAGAAYDAYEALTA